MKLLKNKKNLFLIVLIIIFGIGYSLTRNKYVGNEKFGYVKVPKDWTYNENDDGFICTDEKSVISVKVEKDVDIDIFADLLFNDLKNDTNIQDASMEKENSFKSKIDTYHIKYYNKNKNAYIETWTFKDSNGNMYLMAFSSHDKESKSIEFVDSYTLNK